MIREKVLKEFATWDAEKQLNEYQAYKALGDFSPFTESDYLLMETVMNNPNAEINCKDGVCSIVKEEQEIKEELNTDRAKLLDSLKALKKKNQYIIIDDDLNIFDNPILALKANTKDIIEFFNLLHKDSSFYFDDVVFENNKFVFVSDFDKFDKANKSRVLKIAYDENLFSIDTLIDNIDHDDEIDKDILEKVQKILN
jgi:hypothetical protein